MESDVVPARGLISPCCSARYLLAIMGSFGMGITYALKFNISITMISMINHTAVEILANASNRNMPFDDENLNIHSYIGLRSEGEAKQRAQTDGCLVWSSYVQGLIISSYFWSYMIFQFIGGRLAELTSAKWVFFSCIFINIACTLLNPLAAHLHYGLMIFSRFLQGAGGAVSFPSMHVLLAHWCPPAERGTISNLVYAGVCLGTLLSMLMAGFIADSISWEAVFYIMGGIFIPWLFIWVWLIEGTPRKQKYITEEERVYIEECIGVLGSKKGVRKLPVKEILKSAPFWALQITHISNNWGWYFLLLELPFYFQQILDVNLKENTIISAIPYLFTWIFSLIISKILDTCKDKEIMTNTTAKKISVLINNGVPAIMLTIMAFSGDNRVLVISLMMVALTAHGAMFYGVLSNHIDISPNFAGSLIGITNTAATLSGIIPPIFTSHVTHGNQTIEAWRLLFLVTVGIYLVGVIAFSFWGSGEVQPWNKTEE